MKLGNIIGERINVNEGVSPFDITFLIWENEGKIEGEIEYGVDLLEHETIVRLKENFIRLLELYGENPDLEYFRSFDYFRKGDQGISMNLIILKLQFLIV